MAAGAIVARILTQYSDKGSKAAQKDIQKLGRQIDAFGKKATKAFGLAAAATVALSVKIGSQAVKAAIEDSKSQLTLSNALRTTTGATDEAIRAVEDYISKQQMLTNVQDTELRSSLQSLVVATGDVTEAQRLQSIALDVAAATGKDLRTVTVAMVRAQQGNTTALKRLSPELSGVIKKTTKAEDVFSLLGATYEGSAKKLAKQDPITNMKLAFTELSEQIGNALLPAVKLFTTYMITDLIPTFEEFVKLNQEEITKNIVNLSKAIVGLVKSGSGIASFLIEYRTAITYILGTLATLVSLARTLLLVSSALAILKTLKSIKMAISLTRGSMTAIKGMFSLTRSMTFIIDKARYVAGAIGLITAAFRAQGIAAGAAAIATAFATGGTSVLAAAAALASVGGILYVTKTTYDALTKSQDKNTASSIRATEHAARASQAQQAAALQSKKNAAALEAQRKKDEAARLAAEKVAAAAAKKKAEIEAKTAATKKRIEAATGLRITDADEYELIQLTAVEKLQLKQKEADASLSERIKLRKEELAVFNSLTAKTEQYLDFLKAINSDGKLDNSELLRLMSTWGLTKQQAEKYADFVSAIGDRKLSTTEIDNLKSKWGLTTQQVVDYLAKIGAPVDAKGTTLSAGDIAALGWKNASSALDAYYAKLNQPPPTPELPNPNPMLDMPSYGSNRPDPYATNNPFIPSPPVTGTLRQDTLDYLSDRFGFAASSLAGLDYSNAEAFTGSGTLSNGMNLSSGSAFGTNQNIYINVSGSVTTEQDLVQAVRQGLLQGQSSGYGLLLQEI